MRRIALALFGCLSFLGCEPVLAATYVLDLGWKELNFTNQMALGEAATVELRGIGSADPTNLTLYLSNKAGDMLAITEGMAVTGSYATAELLLNSTNLLDEFDGVSLQGSRAFDLSIWDSDRSVLLASAPVWVRNNPLWETLSFTNLPALESLGLSEYLSRNYDWTNATATARYTLNLGWKDLAFENSMAVAERAVVEIRGIGDAEPAGIMLYLSNRDGEGLALASYMVSGTNDGSVIGILNLATTNLLAEFDGLRPLAERSFDLSVWDSGRDVLLGSASVVVRNNPLADQFIEGWTNIPDEVESELMESVAAAMALATEAKDGADDATTAASNAFDLASNAYELAESAVTGTIDTTARSNAATAQATANAAYGAVSNLPAIPTNAAGIAALGGLTNEPLAIAIGAEPSRTNVVFTNSSAKISQNLRGGNLLIENSRSNSAGAIFLGHDMRYYGRAGMWINSYGDALGDQSSVINFGTGTNFGDADCRWAIESRYTNRVDGHDANGRFLIWQGPAHGGSWTPRFTLLTNIGTLIGGGSGESSSVLRATIIGDYAGRLGGFTNSIIIGNYSAAGAFVSNSMIVGWQAGIGAKGDAISAFGYYAASGAVGSNITAVGDSAGRDATGDYWSAFGGYAGYGSSGEGWTSIGRGSGYGASGDYRFTLGRMAGRSATSNGMLYVDNWQADPGAARNPTNDAIVLDGWTGKLMVGRPDAAIELRGEVTFGGVTLTEWPEGGTGSGATNLNISGCPAITGYVYNAETATFALYGPAVGSGGGASAGAEAEPYVLTSSTNINLVTNSHINVLWLTNSPATITLPASSSNVHTQIRLDAFIGTNTVTWGAGFPSNHVAGSTTAVSTWLLESPYYSPNYTSQRIR